MIENQQNKRSAGMVLIVVLGILIILGGLGFWWYRSHTETKNATAIAQEEERVRGVVTSFGEQLKNVPLTSSSTGISLAVEKYYTPYVTRDLLSTWKVVTKMSPGKESANTSPEYIAITGVYKNADGTYSVDGNVVEKSAANATGTASRTYPIFIMLANEEGTWVITRFDRVSP